MASSNRHWPSMFRSNPACNQQQPDMNNSSSSPLLSAGSSSKSPPISSVCEERSPEPKPRWNPRPEQIRILEGIFNSGMVNPPRDEIRRIRLQLQDYGQVGDANVFYWFQNRKSRTKNKLRAAAAAQQQPSCRAVLTRACGSPVAPAPAPVTPQPMQPPPPVLLASVAPTSSSSSSDRSSGSSKQAKPAVPTVQAMLPATAIDLLSPMHAPEQAAPQVYYHSQTMAPAGPELTSPEKPVLQWPQTQSLSSAEFGGIFGSHAQAPVQSAVGQGLFLGLCNQVLGQECIDKSCTKGLGQYYWCSPSTDLTSKSSDAEVSALTTPDEKAKLAGLLQYAFGVTTLPPTASVDAAATAASVTTVGVPSAAATSNVATSAVTDQLQGLMDAGGIGAPAPMAMLTVAKDAVVCTSTSQYSVPAMQLNVRLFGEAAVLFSHTGEPVLVDEAGITIEPLQQGAVYYVLVE